MKTICMLGGDIVMSQDGESLESMQANADQHPGAIARVITDAEYAILTTPTPVAVQAEINATAGAAIRKLSLDNLPTVIDILTKMATGADKAALQAIDNAIKVEKAKQG